jgi:hypothetical protein
MRLAVRQGRVGKVCENPADLEKGADSTGLFAPGQT